MNIMVTYVRVRTAVASCSRHRESIRYLSVTYNLLSCIEYSFDDSLLYITVQVITSSKTQKHTLKPFIVYYARRQHTQNTKI